MRYSGWLAAGFLLLAGAGLAQPGRLPAKKKLIEYGWDVPTPAYVRDHLVQMQERPFDGVIMRLAGKGGGQVFSGGRWNPADYQADLEALQAIEWGSFGDNFLMIYAASEQDWFSDEDWKAVLANLEIMAKAAKAGRCFLAFDPEPYGKNPWNYHTQAQAGKHSFAAYQEKVRQRGQEFITTIGRQLPDNVLLTLFAYSTFAGLTDLADPGQRQAVLAANPYGLYLSFLNGMLDRLGPRMSIADGNEPSYYYENAGKFHEAHHLMRQRALALVPPGLVPKHQTQVQVSQALYMDYLFGRMGTKGILSWWMSPEERAKWFEHNVYWALRTADEYVWLYSERMNWWTGEGLPEGMEAAAVRAREAVAQGRPLGYDQREVMKEIEARTQAQISQQLVRRTAEVPAFGHGEAPQIDGALDDPAWQRSVALEDFVPLFGTSDQPLKAPTRAWVGWDQRYLYLAVQAEEPLADKLESVGTARDDEVWNGDSIEILLSAREGGVPYFHFALNPRNVQWDAEFTTDHDLNYSPDWNSATCIAAGEWTTEIAIPWTALRLEARPGLQLQADLCRQRRPEPELSSWSQLVRGFLEPGNFGVLTLK
ncbi:MAG: carbohydrate-binding family 9-like protein [Candidatus Latescibacteria bacterium]|nr:carbohydrate-binding family 9-like protein [Candidatus Latescibacterota bacterium]